MVVPSCQTAARILLFSSGSLTANRETCKYATLVGAHFNVSGSGTTLALMTGDVVVDLVFQ